MKRIIYTLALILFLAGIFPGCKDALEIEPQQSIDAATALTSRDGINAAVVSVYSRLKTTRLYGRDLIALPEAIADNGVAVNKSGRLVTEAANVFRAHFAQETWQQAYSGINQANLIIEAVPTIEAPGITPADKNLWLGEMHFLRALYHLNIALPYAYIPGAVVSAQDKGGIPLMLKSTNTSSGAIDLKPSRASINDVYASIVADLEVANQRLSFPGSNYPSIANKAAAQALLARVNLYRKDYAAAKKWADSCITLAGSRLTTAATYVSSWRSANHSESLFQIIYATNAENNGVNESLQTTFTTMTAPGNTTTLGGFGDLVPSLPLLTGLGITRAGGNVLNSFRDSAIASRSSDVRNLLYELGSNGRAPGAFVECTKFIGKNGFPNLDNVPVIRIAEVYLTRAEALSTTGSSVFNEAAALADLNTIATNRGLPAFALTGSALYEEVLNQRRLELAFEGHRFWDLKRLGRDLVKAPHYSNVAFTDIRILAPIPTREVDGNKNLLQNAGY